MEETQSLELQDHIYQAEGEDAMQQHSISESQDQGESDNYQAKGEDAMQRSIAGLHKKRQLRNTTNALHILRTWGKGALNGRWVECPHGAVKIEGYQKRPYGFMMHDGSSMPRCKKPDCIKQMKSFKLSHDASKLQHGTSTGGEGVNEVNRVQFRDRWTVRGNTMVISSKQQIYIRSSNTQGNRIK